VGDPRSAPVAVLDLFGAGPFGAEPAAPTAGSGTDVEPAAGAHRHTVPPRWGGRRLRGRHVRPAGYSRVPIMQEPPEAVSVEENLVLHVLRRRPVDLDTVQVAALTGLPPSVAADTLHELVRNGLARDVLVGSRLRFGLP